MAKKKSTSNYDIEHLKQYARDGAAAALTRLRTEIETIERTFPELSTSKGRTKLVAKAGKTTRSWSAQSRKAVSARMKKYWAARRKAAKKAGK